MEIAYSFLSNLVLDLVSVAPPHCRMWWMMWQGVRDAPLLALLVYFKAFDITFWWLFWNILVSRGLHQQVCLNKEEPETRTFTSGVFLGQSYKVFKPLIFQDRYININITFMLTILRFMIPLSPVCTEMQRTKLIAI